MRAGPGVVQVGEACGRAWYVRYACSVQPWIACGCYGFHGVRAVVSACWHVCVGHVAAYVTGWDLLDSQTSSFAGQVKLTDERMRTYVAPSSCRMPYLSSTPHITHAHTLSLCYVFLVICNTHTHTHTYTHTQTNKHARVQRAGADHGR